MLAPNVAPLAVYDGDGAFIGQLFGGNVFIPNGNGYVVGSLKSGALWTEGFNYLSTDCSGPPLTGTTDFTGLLNYGITQIIANTKFGVSLVQAPDPASLQLVIPQSFDSWDGTTWNCVIETPKGTFGPATLTPTTFNFVPPFSIH
jgi:hypothetical protein